MFAIRQFKIIVFIVILFICISCIGDGGVQIKGNMVDVNDTPVNNCSLKIYMVGGSRPLHDIEINSEFDTMLTISPGTHEYFFVIKCGDDFYYKSKVYWIGAIEYDVKNPLNLGKIVLKKKAN